MAAADRQAGCPGRLAGYAPGQELGLSGRLGGSLALPGWTGRCHPQPGPLPARERGKQLSRSFALPFQPGGVPARAGKDSRLPDWSQASAAAPCERSR